jgi:hypothetical protein
MKNKKKIILGAFYYFFVQNKIVGFAIVLPIILIITLILHLI